MPAPAASVLDNFNRANGGPGSNWANAVSTYNLPNIVSNALDWPQFPSAYWTTQFAADQEAFVRIAGVTTSLMFMLRMTGLNTGAEQGYFVMGQPADGAVEAWKWSAGAGTAVSLGFENGVLLSTDLYLWATIIGSTISLYGGSDGVNYTLRKTWTDSTYNRAGYIGLFSPNNVAPSTLDNFGGGTIASLTLDNCLPDADITTTGWTSTPLFSKVNDLSDATVIQATAS